MKRNSGFARAWFLLGCLLFAILRTGAAAPPPFLHIENNALYLGDLPFRNIGVTIPDLFDRFLSGHEASAEKALADAETVGARFVRCAAIPSSQTLFSRYRSDPKGYFAAFDAMQAALQKHHLLLVPSLLWDGQTLVRATQEPNGGLRALFTAGTPAYQLAKAYITAMVSRYANDPYILFWEIGSDLDRKADILSPNDPVAYSSDLLSAFLGQMAQQIHRLDKRHLVCSGNGMPRPDAWNLYESRRQGVTQPAGPPQPLDTLPQFREMMALRNPTGIDILGVHLVPPGEATPLWLTRDDTQALTLPWVQRIALDLHRPLFVGAFGQAVQNKGVEQNAPWMLNLMQRLQITDAPLAAVQNWESDPPTDFTLSLQATPRLAVALKTANAFIADTVIRHVLVALPPQLFATETAVANDRLHTLAIQLQTLSLPLLQAMRLPPNGKQGSLINRTGTSLLLPYEQSLRFRVADLALLAQTGFLSSKELEGWIRLLARLQNGSSPLHFPEGLTVPTYSIPDWIAPDGTACWFPDAKGDNDQGTGAFGHLPPADGAFWFLLLVQADITQHGDPNLLRVRFRTAQGSLPLWQVCENAFNSIAADGATGLVAVGGTSQEARADWVFADRVQKAGFCLMPSLLRLQAAQILSTLFSAIDDAVRARDYQSLADRIRASLVSTFYVPLGQVNGKDVGLLLSATKQGRREDVWASAYALVLQALPSDIGNAVSRHLDQLYRAGGLTLQGYVRALPPSGSYGGYWEASTDAPDTGENGGYWGFPVGWLAVAIAQTDRPAAIQLLQQYADSLEKELSAGAPWEWRNGKTLFGAHCLLSAAYPAESVLEALTGFLSE
jgi:hypothetical protein